MIGYKFFTIIPEKTAYIIERFGKFHSIRNPGLNFLIPVLDRIAYSHSLKEDMIAIEKQQAITKDNVSLQIDGSVFIKIKDPYLTSYQVETPRESVKLMALTILRSEIGKMKLDELFQERQNLNIALYKGVNAATEAWGIECMRCEILSIDPPEEIKKSMQFQAEAERLKRRDILTSEGKQQSEINISEGQRVSTIKKAEGDAESVELIAKSESQAIQMISNVLKQNKGQDTINYILMKRYLQTLKQVLKGNKVVVVPEQKDGQGSDAMLGMIGMMLMNQYNIPHNLQSQDQKQVEQPKQQSQMNDKLIEELARKGQFYDDISLYSSEEEKNRK